MAEKRMACWNCPRYERGERQCVDGKANPRSKVDSVMVAEALGLRALCHYNLYRDALTLRRHFPTTAAAIASVAPRKKSGKRSIEPQAATPTSLPTADEATVPT